MMRVLLIEDSPLLRASIMDMLSTCPNVSIDDYAVNQQEAIELLNQKQYDLMIADIELAQGNGLNVIQHTLHDNYAFKRPMTLVLTNHTNGYYKSMARKLGVNYFFDKSMDFEVAIQTIETVSEAFTESPQ
jgi:DNA-binding NarL/FixJ family response regulator